MIAENTKIVRSLSINALDYLLDKIVMDYCRENDINYEDVLIHIHEDGAISFSSK